MDLVNISIPAAGGYALLGYAVVFFGLVLLMIVMMVMGKIMHKEKPAAAPVAEAPAKEVPVKSAPTAPGTAGEFKLYDTDPRDAALAMAIIADTLHKPLNELRFISIREVK